MRLLVTMVVGLLSVLLGPSLAREGRARSVGSSMTLLTRCRSSWSQSTPRRPPGSWLARGERLLWVRRPCRRISLRRPQHFGVVPVVGMPYCCPSLLPGLGVGVVGTLWPTMAPSSSSVRRLWLCPWAVGRGVSGIIEWRAWGISFVVLSWVSLRMDGGWAARPCWMAGGWGWTFAGIICVLWDMEWARSGGFVFMFVLRGTCWGCLSRGGEGAGLLDGFVS